MKRIAESSSSGKPSLKYSQLKIYLMPFGENEFKMVSSKIFIEGSFFSAATDVLSALDNIGYKVALTLKVI